MGQPPSELRSHYCMGQLDSIPLVKPDYLGQLRSVLIYILVNVIAENIHVHVYNTVYLPVFTDYLGQHHNVQID